MADNAELLESILEKLTGETRMFSTKEIIMISMIIFAGAGQWYATQSRIDALEIYIKSQTAMARQDFKSLHQQASSNGSEISNHIQWEMEMKLKEKQDIIDRLNGVK